MPGDEEHKRQDEKQDAFSFLSSASHQTLEAFYIYLCGNPLSVPYWSQSWSIWLIAKKLGGGRSI